MNAAEKFGVTGEACPDRCAMALSKFRGDEHVIILGRLCNPLEPRLAVYVLQQRQSRAVGADDGVAADAED